MTVKRAPPTIATGCVDLRVEAEDAPILVRLREDGSVECPRLDPVVDAAEALVESLSHAGLELDAEGWRRLDALRAALLAAGRRDGYAWAEAREGAE